MSLVDISDGTHLGITDIQPFRETVVRKKHFRKDCFLQQQELAAGSLLVTADKDLSRNCKYVLATNEEKMTSSKRA